MGLLFSLLKKRKPAYEEDMSELHDMLLLDEIRTAGRLTPRTLSFWGLVEPGEAYPQNAPVGSMVVIPIYDKDGKVLKYDCRVLIDEWKHYKYIDVQTGEENKEEKENDDV